MPFVAYAQDGSRIVATKQNSETWESLRATNRSEPFHLIECGSRVNLVKGEYTRFFRHAQGSDCDVDRFHGGGESAEHLAAKEDLIRGVESVPGWSAEPEYAAPDRSWIADVMAFGPDGEMLALEVQRSGQDPDRYRERQMRYWNAGVQAFWFASHGRKTSVDWDTSGGYPIIAVDLHAGKPPVLRRHVPADNLIANRGSRSLRQAAIDLLLIPSDLVAPALFKSLTTISQERMVGALASTDVEPVLVRMVNPSAVWLVSATEREAESAAARAFLRQDLAAKEQARKADQKARSAAMRSEQAALREQYRQGTHGQFMAEQSVRQAAFKVAGAEIIRKRLADEAAKEESRRAREASPDEQLHPPRKT